MNYSTLFITIKGYLESDFPDTIFYGSDGTTATTLTSVQQINTFITQAEQRIYNSVQFPSLRKNVTGTATTSNKYLSCPTDFLASYSMAVISPTTGAYSFLLNKDVNFIRESFPTPTDTGTPAYYALFGPTTTNATPPVPTTELSFLLGPTPDATYSVELHYYYYPESIIQRPITGLGSVTGGSSYTNGTYSNVPLTGGSGSGAIGDVVVAGGIVTSVSLVSGGTGYVVADTLSATAANIGGSGTGFSIPVSTVGNTSGQSWLGDNIDSVLLYGAMVEACTFQKAEADIYAAYNGKYQEALALAKRLGDGLERQDAYRSGQARIPVK
jgi:hypothetical protein